MHKHLPPRVPIPPALHSRFLQYFRHVLQWHPQPALSIMILAYPFRPAEEDTFPIPLHISIWRYNP